MVAASWTRRSSFWARKNAPVVSNDSTRDSGLAVAASCLRQSTLSAARVLFEREPTHVTMQPASSPASRAYASRHCFRSWPGLSLKACTSISPLLLATASVLGVLG
eukprot:CAMPEP_0181354698 /NCGR_PEP_ID=MMETSP1106-20121128/3500_1 /TAXON_ID=81844 /ORGANISM="Mantoniella antarctica, Strain SL-175" /LENGTH=105 /DNA_ID=CAMNT_0023467379 /DNA_START=337 /DNA_END=651 /DNA_ORIENTATION=+